MSARVGLIGWPVAHSRSPAIHGAAFEALGIEGRYETFAVPPDELAERFARLDAEGVVGLNVTLPHKIAIRARLDRIEPAAEAIGAVNTLYRDGSAWVGANTDAPGLVRSLEDAGLELEGRRALVLGAGGAARAAVVGLREAGASVRASARRREAAEALGVEAVSWDPPGLSRAFGEADLLVQATSATLERRAGAQAFADALPIEALPDHAAVVDLVYAPRVTTVLARAQERGLETVDGLGMLVWQAALAFEIWFGQRPPIAPMRAAAAR